MFITRFSNNMLSGKIVCDRGVYIVTGQVQQPQGRVRLFYRSPEPTNLLQSIAGSGLPFPNPEMAFGPVNSGEARLDESGNFKFQVLRPNTYYEVGDIANGIGQGKLLALPRLNFRTVSANNVTNDLSVILDNQITPLRSLTNYPGKRIRSTGRNTPTMFV